MNLTRKNYIHISNAKTVTWPKFTTVAYVDEKKRRRQKKWAAEAENGCWMEKMGAGGAEIS